MNSKYIHRFKSLFLIFLFTFFNCNLSFSQNSNGDWYTHEDKDLGFRLQLPEQPNYTDDYETFIIYSFTASDTKKIYSFFALDLRNTSQDISPAEQSENFIANIINNLNGELLDKKSIEYTNGIRQEVLVKLNAERQLKAQFTLQNGVLYYLSVEDKNDVINDDSIYRYFNSLKVDAPKALKVKEWITYNNNEGAFSLQLPDEPEDLSREYPNPLEPEGDPYYLNMFMIADKANHDNYLFRYNDQPLGYYMQDVEDGFEKIEISLTEKSVLASPPKTIFLDGYEGREYEILLQEKYHSICRVYFRGNRTYLLLMQKLKEGEKATTENQFFNSFKFEPYQNTELTSFNPPDANFEIQFFEDQRSTIDTLDYDDTYLKNSNDFYSKNINSGGVYQVSYSDIQDYFRVKELDSFYNLNKELLLSWNDSIIKEKKIKTSSFSGLEYIAKNESSKAFSRHRLWIANKRFYLISAYLSKEELESPIAESIFNSMTVSPNDETFDIYASKADLIFKNLTSKDSITLKRALGALNYYEFEKTDVPQFYQAIKINYKDSTTTANVREKLVDALYITNDDDTLEFLEELYNDETISDPLKASILTTIPNLSNENALEVYRKLLTSNPPLDEDSFPWSIVSPFRDSINFATTYFKDLLVLNTHTKYRGNVLSISAEITDSLGAKNTVINSKLDILLKYADDDLSAYLKTLENDEDYDYTYNSLMFNYLYLFNNLNTNHPKVDSFTKILANNEDNKWLQTQAITSRIYNYLDLEKKLVNTQLDSMFSRYEMIEALHKTNQLKRIPKKYLKPEALAKLALYNYVGEDDGYPDNLSVLGTLTEDDNTYYVMSYSYNTEDESSPEQYIGIVGPIEPITSADEFKRYKSYSSWDLLEDDWKKQAQLLIPNLIEYGY